MSPAITPEPNSQYRLWMTDTALPCASAATIAIVSPSSAAPRAWPRRSPGDAAAPLGEAHRVEAMRDRDALEGRVGQVTVAVLEGELRRLDDEVDVVGLGERSDVEPLEERQDRQGSEALRRRGQARRLAAAVGNAQGLDPLGPVRGEILDGQRTAGGGGAECDPSAERAAVERVDATPRKLLERRAEVGLHEALARQERRMIDTPERRAQPGRRGGAEQIVGVRRLAALTGRGWKAVARAAIASSSSALQPIGEPSMSRLMAWASHHPDTTPGTVSAAAPPRSGIAAPKRAR